MVKRFVLRSVQWNGAVIVRCAKFERFWIWRSGVDCRDVRIVACDACRVCWCCDLLGPLLPVVFSFPRSCGREGGLASLGSVWPRGVFSDDAPGNTLLMPLEGCDAGAVAGISRFFLVCAVVDGTTSIVEFDLVMNGAAAAKHEFDSEFKQANGTAAACCLAAEAATLCRLFYVIDGTNIVNADALTALVCVFDQMVPAAAAKHEIVGDLSQVNGSAAACFLATAVAAFLGACTSLCSWLFGFCNSGETDRLRAMSSISGPGINAFSWCRGCKGKLKNKEREVFASFSSTVTPVVQVSSFGILAGRLLVLCEREFWEERHWSIIDNDVRDAVVDT